MKPLFSIIIPLYNKESFIEKTLNSVLKQSFTDFEIILINDGSTDNSLNIAKKLLESFYNKTIVSRPNKGLSATRNEGVKLAKGKIIALLDADDYWQKNYLKEIHNLYIKFNNASVFGTDYLEINNHTTSSPVKNISKKLKDKAFIIEDFFNANCFQSIICQSSICLKKEVFDFVSFNENIEYSEDIDFYLNLFTNDFILAYKYSPLSYVNVNAADQITSSKLGNKTIPDFNFYEKHIQDYGSLKHFLDFNRYTFASKYKQEGNKKKFEELVSQINFENLNRKQHLLLNAPFWLFKTLIRIKQFLYKRNIRWSTYQV